MSRVTFKHLKAGVDKVSASQYNRLVDVVEAMASALFREGIYFSGSGFATRQGSGGSSTEIKLAKAQESAQADEYVSCKLLNAAGSEIGDAFDVEGLIVNAGSALNECVPRIVSDDVLPIFKANDGNWYFTTEFQPTEDCDCYEAP